MSLRWKVVISLAIVSVLFTATTYSIQRWIVVPGFLAAEYVQAKTDLARCVEALRRDGEHLSGLTRDWGAWDDTYRYAQDRNDEYRAMNLIPNTYSINHLHLLAIVDLGGELIWGEVRDSKTEELIDAQGILQGICRPGHRLLDLKDTQSEVTGVLMTEIGPMLISSHPIVTSQETGPLRGALVMGRLLNEEAIAELAGRTRVELKLWSIQGDVIPADGQEALCHLTSANQATNPPVTAPTAPPGNASGPDKASWLMTDDPSILRGYSVIRDIFDQPALLLRADLPRTISLRGMTAAKLATATSVAGGFALLLVLWFVLQRAVLGPLTTLSDHAVRVGRDCDLRARLNMTRRDEIGVLAGEFDRMVVNLAEFRVRLLETARRAGMADVAAEVLHNVGNVLNSVNVSANVVAEKLRHSEAPGLGMAAQLMAEHQDDLAGFLTGDERGRQLPVYLAELARYLTDEQNTMLAEMKALSESVEHIKQVIAAQNEHSVTTPMVEAVDPSTLLEEALRLNTDSFNRHRITVVREYDDVGETLLDRHKLLQILVNLIKNAKNALRESEQPDRKITLRVERVGGQEADRLRISIADNGIGIPPENLSRLFAFGFSTRKDGNGYGLHSAANLARELAGTLTAESDGPSRGARFILEIPIVREQVRL